MEIRERLNPRSFRSIRAAIQGGRIRNRGQLLREMHDAFRNPPIPKVKLEVKTDTVKDVNVPPKGEDVAGDAKDVKVVMSAEAAEAAKVVKAAETVKVDELIDVAVTPAKGVLPSGGASPGTEEGTTITEGKDGAIK